MGDSGDPLQDIIDGAFAAAVDDGLWIPWMDNLVARLGAAGTFLGIANRRLGTLAGAFINVDHLPSNIAYEEYVGGRWMGDPQIHHVCRLDRSAIYTDRDHVRRTNPVTDDYMKWQEDRLGWVSHLTFASVLDEDLAAGVSVHFTRESAELAEAGKERVRAMAGSVGAALHLGFVHNERLTEAYWQGLLAERDQLAVFLLDERGAVMRANRMALRLIERAGPLRLRFNRLACSDHREQTQLQTLVDRSIAPSGARAGAVRIGRYLIGAHYIVQCIPLVRKTRFLVASEPAALTIVHRKSARTVSNADLWQQLFDLTPAEAKIADLLETGLSPTDISDRLCITLGTVRTHIKAIHQKTDTRRNAELAHLLTRLDGRS